MQKPPQRYPVAAAFYFLNCLCGFGFRQQARVHHLQVVVFGKIQHEVVGQGFDLAALQAFEHAAVDYVLKPINDARLSKTIERLKLRVASAQERDDELETVIGKLRALAPAAAVGSEKLTLIRAASGNQIHLIPIEEVVYFEATDKYVNVITADSQLLIRTSLKELLPQLDHAQFWQIHRGTIVNSRQIQVAIRDELGKLTIKLRDRKETLQVSRVFAHLFKQM